MNKIILISAGACVLALALLYTLFTQKSVMLSSCTVKHLGIIMDGNRRWAKKHGYKPWIGHKKGVEPLKVSVDFCLKNNIPALTVYAFSLENFKRPQEELSYLFDTLAQELVSTELQTLFEKGVRVRFIGDKTQFPPQLLKSITDITEKTKENRAVDLNILFCYSGQQEILAAAQSLVNQAHAGTLRTPITAEQFERELWTHDLTAPDLIIRTGGAQRLSGFLTYHAAYSELLFVSCYWPEITEADLMSAVNNYEQRQRNYGA